jgi:ketosteroid isomerase-like protein
LSTQSIVENHLDALVAGDVDRVMADYADDAVMITAGMGTAEGTEALRTTFSMIPTEMFSGFETTELVVSGETAMVTWKTDGLSFGTDTFVVRDDKIVAQTVAFSA